MENVTYYNADSRNATAKIREEITISFEVSLKPRGDLLIEGRCEKGFVYWKKRAGVYKFE